MSRATKAWSKRSTPTRVRQTGRSALLIAVIACFLAFSETLGKVPDRNHQQDVEASTLLAFFFRPRASAARCPGHLGRGELSLGLVGDEAAKAALAKTDRRMAEDRGALPFRT